MIREKLARWLRTYKLDEVEWVTNLKQEAYIDSLSMIADQIIALLSEGAEPPMLSDVEIKERLGEIQPEGFDWENITETEMVKLRAISQAAIENSTPYWLAREAKAGAEVAKEILDKLEAK